MSNFWHDSGELIIGIVVVVAITTGVVFGVMKFEQAQCIAKTENMGFASRWSWLGGCQIEVVEGQWIPLESYYFKQEEKRCTQNK